MNEDSKIYIAGHNGMVGSAVDNHLNNNGFTNIIKRDTSELDLRNQKDTLDFFESEMPEYVFLAAAKVGGIIANNSYPAEFIYDNIAIAMNVIHASYKTGVKKLLNLGSSCIFPKYAQQPIKEEYLLAGKLEETNEPYAIAKIAAIKLCKYYNEQYNTDFISLMPTNLFGYNDNYNMETSHVLPALIRKMYLAKALMNNDFDSIIKDAHKYELGFGYYIKENYSQDEIIEVLSKFGIKKDKLVLWGSGNARREFLFADCLADASIYFMQNISGIEMGDFVNIGSGVDLSIKELANIIRNKIGYQGKIEFDNEKPDGTPQKLLDITKAQTLGWIPECDLDSGLDKVIYYYINNEKMNEENPFSIE
jgi:GDP-L-fucose synthase